ncbi:aminopeptidase P family protein [Ktedonosporobacter rubrisoli]|uniref:Aminopeptidase P family protein n=1 Tax=Ktedonosporobacter rubrisoli TaxID=2509675 RepID=A0A4P6JSC0_KTERU|nr:aminopeptidase P family protein [Ktedonosporobacter rubrisoli]QBD78407.1 aminopeptidase P family protein [Ktedonosporobacter rubrisoli]
MSQESVTQLRRWIAEQGLDAFLVKHLQNRAYLCGWLNEDSEEGGALLLDQQHQILLTNALYAEVAGHEAKGWEIDTPPAREYAARIAELARTYGWKKIGFEADWLSYAEYEKLNQEGNGSYTLQPFVQSNIEELRQVKQPYELDLLKRAIAITDQTFAHVCDWIQPGLTEKEVQWEISRVMVSLGAEGPSFTTIVASGPNSSMPHAHASERQIQRGEFITIDMGARYKGYCADMTRTICLGEPAEPRMLEIYNAVLQAMKTCEQGLHAGISGRAADALARDVLAQKELAEYYVHSTGHGVGLQIHEAPSLSQRAPEDMLLPAGSVVTVEPGVYIPGWGGVRIEDCVALSEDGAEVLTQSPTALVIQR